MCVHVYALSIVSRDKILRFKNTFIVIISQYVTCSHKRGMVRKGVLLGRVWLERLGMKDYNRKGMVGKGVTGCTGKVIAVRSIALLQSNSYLQTADKPPQHLYQGRAQTGSCTCHCCNTQTSWSSPHRNPNIWLH